MRNARISFLLLCAFALLCFQLQSFAQCQSRLLCALDEQEQKFTSSVWTTDPHCPANGTIEYSTVPPGAANFGYMISSFFDVFTEVSIDAPPVTPGGLIGVPFEMIATVTYTDPVYPQQTYSEMVQVNIMTGRLEIFRPSVCADAVPASMPVGSSACFRVCHKIYRIDLGPSIGIGEPIIRVTPGCLPTDPCFDFICTPGGPEDYRTSIYQMGGRWILEFEYSNPALQPVCYCVTYTGNLPLNYMINDLSALNEQAQTYDLTLWTNDPAHIACGTLELFSYPAGAYIAPYSPGPLVSNERFTISYPVGAGSFLPGQQFKLISYLNWGPPCVDFRSQWQVETVVVTPNGGLQIVDPTGNCSTGGGDIIPATIPIGAPVCLKVCHNIYHIPISCPPNVTPVITVTPGCGMTTPCSSPTMCTAGGSTDYRYDLYRVGGTWILEFEYSNSAIEPVCYCVQANPGIPTPLVGYGLAAMNPMSQTFDVSVWTNSPSVPASGFIALESIPAGAEFDMTIQSFFDVFLETFTIPVFVTPGTFTPGQNFQLVADFSFYTPGIDPIHYEENVIVTPAGQLVPWNPLSPCVSNVPPAMNPGQSACLTVCHGIYDIALLGSAGINPPSISVVPGCNLPCTNPGCMPGGESDYCYRFNFDGAQWHLIFEYSNPYVQPVCYCVTYNGNRPDCTPHQLLGLDESRQTLNLTLWNTSLEGTIPCPTDGNVTIFSYPSGAYIGPYLGNFTEVGADWYTIPVAVGPGTMPVEQVFQLIAHIDYSNPDYPDVWKIEDVYISHLDPTTLWVADEGGECGYGGGAIVPTQMNVGESTCFKVCHKVYHVLLNGNSDTPPQVNIALGCYGPERDNCVPDFECTPGGEFDYRYEVVWNAEQSSWELVFEYSNPDIEPVCYCVTIPQTVVPCLPVTDLVIDYGHPIGGGPNAVRLNWTCPQRAAYTIYSTTYHNNISDPLLDPSWTPEATLYLTAGPAEWSPPAIIPALYMNYIILSDCTPPQR